MQFYISDYLLSRIIILQSEKKREKNKVINEKITNRKIII